MNETGLGTDEQLDQMRRHQAEDPDKATTAPSEVSEAMSRVNDKATGPV